MIYEDDLIDRYYKERNDDSVFNYNKYIEFPNMLKLVGDVTNKKILDLGCGFGDHAKSYSDNKASSIIGLDNASKIIEIAKKRNILNSKFILHDLNSKISLESESFDIVVSSLTIHYVKNFELLISEVRRLLKPNGIFIFSTGNSTYISMLKNIDGFDYIMGAKKQDGKLKIYGDYFSEKMIIRTWNNGDKVELYPRTYETLVKTCLKHNFELIDYVDAKPIEEVKDKYPEKYELTTKISSFCFFK